MSRQQTAIGDHGKVSAKQRDPKTWVARTGVRMADGTTRSVTASGRTKAIAENAVEAKAKLVGAHSTNGITPQTRIGELVDIYLQKTLPKQKVHEQTRDRYAASARRTIRPAFAEVRVHELTPSRILSWLEGLAEEHLSEARTCRVVLRAILHQALRAGAIGRNPVADADVRLGVPKKQARALTLPELARLRELLAVYRAEPGTPGPKPTVDLLDVIDVMLGSGCRISEVLALRPEDVYVDGDTVSIDVNATVIYSAKTGGFRQPVAKSAESMRRVKLPSFAADIVRRRAVDGTHPLLFATKRGTPYQQQNLNRTLRAALAGTDLDWVTSHVFRKTAGTTVFRRAGLAATRQFLAHTDERITAGTYVDRDGDVGDHRDALQELGP